uniref:Mitochondrial genome maintenance exonuclease 1 n=1 Tax=Haemonchus placei TaxID=6290 RepID=A0A0N4WND0_HAEPC
MPNSSLDTATSSQASKSTTVAPVHRPCSPPLWVAAIASKSLQLHRLRYFNVATALQPPSRGASVWGRGTCGVRSAPHFQLRSSSTRLRRGRPLASTGLSRQDAALREKTNGTTGKVTFRKELPRAVHTTWLRGHPRPRPSRYADIRSEWVTSELPIDQYRPVPPVGYHATRWVRSLFPVFIRDLPSTSNKIPVMELQTLKAAIHFREKSAAIIRSTLDGQYHEPVRENQQTPLKSYSSTLAPPRSGGFHPVLYQVVAVGYGNGVILEAKDFFVVGPDRRDLHCIVLEQYAIDLTTNMRGFDRSPISVQDLLWIYSVTPTGRHFKIQHQFWKGLASPELQRWSRRRYISSTRTDSHS